MATAIINADRALSIFISTAWFPTIGKEGVLYFAQDVEETYRWDVNSGTYVLFAGATGGVTDHGLLIGLADDDHPQYALDTDLTAHVEAADPHPGYLTPAEGNAAYHPLMRDHISGLIPVWVSATAINVTAGSAYINSLGRVYESTATISLTGIVTAASTMYYLYLYDNAGTPAIEIVTAVPVIYSVTAAHKTGDTSRRYIGSILSGAANTIFQFRAYAPSGNKLVNEYTEQNNAAPFRVLSGGTATTPTAVSITGIVPEVVYAGFIFGAVMQFPTAGGDAAFGVGHDFKSGAVSPELSMSWYGRAFSATAGKVFYFPPAEIPIFSRSVYYVTSQATNTDNALYIDTHGYSVNR